MTAPLNARSPKKRKRNLAHRFAVRCFQCGAVELFGRPADGIAYVFSRNPERDVLMKLGWTDAKTPVAVKRPYDALLETPIWLCPTCSEGWTDAKVVKP